ncbi:ABC transporter ATP-binding protein [Salinicoccus halodurans]|uniref:Carnitine transport ATP-binding protein OpuCA n=1 Tax=Salinicoccus halodurans TaxID=407035 RepID=A0A0F7HKA4_9STAP|nr:ABC transporter ATP-binding protein [Salinicoccus halodurans]AKG73916.1 glycine/betaine ABC transporter ATP-binding protein [Salinicoccus halodurans]SFK57720.1 osmoprotectant transport system ATP-binding protein [Salinicoccus halodurans]
MIQFKNVTKKYGDKIAVDDLSFDIKEGEIFVLIGPSGCGKTTTLKMINRLIPLTSGYIYFKERPISEYPVYEMRWDIGYVLQQIALFPHMSIKENIAQVPLMKKWTDSDIDDRIDELLTMVGMEPEQFKNRKPKELSGGQQQRVGVVRALAADPPVILMDEPFSALDPISREKLQDDLIELQKTIKKTIVFVTHDIQEALKLGDRICLLKEGHAEQIGTPEAFLTMPENDFVKDFIGDLDTHRMQQLTIGDIADSHPAGNNTDYPDYPIVPDDTQIQVAFQHLSEHDGIIVNGEDDNKKILKSQDVFRYLADRQGGAER